MLKVNVKNVIFGILIAGKCELSNALFSIKIVFLYPNVCHEQFSQML